MWGSKVKVYALMHTFANKIGKKHVTGIAESDHVDTKLG